MTSNAKLLNMVRQFMADQEGTILNALRNQERDMRDAAEEARKGYEQYKNAPEAPRKPLPDSGTMTISLMPTANGLKHMAEMFTAEADKAEKAAEEWEKLTEALEDDDQW